MRVSDVNTSTQLNQTHMMNQKMTDFEKYIISRNYIGILKKEMSKLLFNIGVLTSELDELKYLTANEKKEFKKEYYTKERLEEKKYLESKLSKTNKENREMFHRLVLANQKLKENGLHAV